MNAIKRSKVKCNIQLSLQYYLGLDSGCVELNDFISRLILNHFVRRDVVVLGLKQLRRLSLSRNAIKSVGRHALSGLPSLEQLDLSDNVISTIQGESRGSK
jgi:Leucine-rich repeat (LRR) protein